MSWNEEADSHWPNSCQKSWQEMENNALMKTQQTGLILRGHIWNGTTLRSKSWKSFSIKKQNNSCLFWIFLDQFPKETRLTWSHCVLCMWMHTQSPCLPAQSSLLNVFLNILSCFDEMYCRITIFGIQYSKLLSGQKKGNSERLPKRAWLKSSFITRHQRSHIWGKWPKINFHKSLFS